jgi:hypothetical protein
VGKQDKKDAEEWLEVMIDQLEQAFGLEGGFIISFALARKMQERWEKSETVPPLPKDEVATKLLADFALANLMAQHRQLHDKAMQYQTRVRSLLEL